MNIMLNKHKPKHKGKKELIKLMLSKPYLLANLQMFGCVHLATTSHFFVDGKVVTNPHAL